MTFTKSPSRKLIQVQWKDLLSIATENMKSPSPQLLLCNKWGLSGTTVIGPGIKSLEEKRIRHKEEIIQYESGEDASRDASTRVQMWPRPEWLGPWAACCAGGGVPTHGRSWNWMVFKVPFKPNPFYSLWL